MKELLLLALRDNERMIEAVAPVDDEDDGSLSIRVLNNMRIRVVARTTSFVFKRASTGTSAVATVDDFRRMAVTLRHFFTDCGKIFGCTARAVRTEISMQSILDAGKHEALPLLEEPHVLLGELLRVGDEWIVVDNATFAFFGALCDDQSAFEEENGIRGIDLEVCLLQPSQNCTIVIARYDNRLAVIRGLLVHEVDRVFDFRSHAINTRLVFPELGNPVLVVMMIARMRINNIVQDEVLRVQKLHDAVFSVEGRMNDGRLNPTLMNIARCKRECPLGRMNSCRSEFHVEVDEATELVGVELTSPEQILINFDEKRAVAVVEGGNFPLP